MTFSEFKAEIINRQKVLEINQFLHLYLKATTYADIAALVKQADFKWAYSKGIIDNELILQMPQADREAAGFYTSAVSLSDLNSTAVYILEGGELTLSQSGTNRCTVYMLGGQMTATATDTSMIEIESYLSSITLVTADSDSFIHISSFGASNVTVHASGNSIVKLNAGGSTMNKLYNTDESYNNVIAVENTTIVFDREDHYTLITGDNASISFTV